MTPHQERALTHSFMNTMDEYTRLRDYVMPGEVAKANPGCSSFSASRTGDRHRQYAIALLLGNVSLSVSIIIAVLLAFCGIISHLGPRVSDYPIRGIDVSHHQGAINWTEVAESEARFAYIKASEGGDFRDPRFDENWTGAKEAGVVPGGYHIFTHCQSGLDQARNFIEALPKETGTLPPAIDISSSNRCSPAYVAAELNAEFSAFVTEIGLYYGRNPVIYSSGRSVLDEAVSESEGRPWLRGLLIHPRASAGNDWLFWQYRINGVTRGIRGDVHMNVFNGGEQVFRRFLEE